MNIQPLVRKVLLGAVESSLDIAGAAILPGAWPIHKGTLTPVLEQLKERIGGDDPKSYVEAAQKAVEAFEADPNGTGSGLTFDISLNGIKVKIQMQA